MEMFTRDSYCAREINVRNAMAKESFITLDKEAKH
jgi:hypothetical protein